MSMAVAHPPTTHDALAAHYLGRWRSPRLTAADIERAETWATATDGAMAMLTVQGAWRAKVMNGTLWVKWLGAKGTWQERASVLRILLAAVDGAGTGRLPDVDFVYVHSDQDPSPRRGWPCTGPVPRTCRGPQVAVLTNAIEHAGGAKASFPVPELTWVGWGERVPPWCRLSRTLRETAARHPWERRDDRAFFSGSLENGRWRRRLGALARVQHEEGATDLFVHSVDSAFLRWGKAKGSGLGANRAEGAAGSSASLPVEASCGYRYALSLPGHGYSSRLKTLLACGCVVIHVHSPWNEWYQPLLIDGVHYVKVDRVDQILPTLRAMRLNSTRARAIGAAASRFARDELSMDRVLGYFRTLLAEMARRSPDRVTLPEPAPGGPSGYSRVATDDDVARLSRLCDCSGAPNRSAACGGGKALRRTSRRHLELSARHRCCVGYDCPHRMAVEC